MKRPTKKRGHNAHTTITSSNQLSKHTLALSKALSNRIPAEVWRLIAVYTIDEYNVITGHRSGHDEVYHLDANKVQDILDIQSVSRAFDEGVKVGFRRGFSGRVTVEDFPNNMPNLIHTQLALQLRELRFHRSFLVRAKYGCNFVDGLVQAASVQSYPNLQRISFMSNAMFNLDSQECLEGSHDDKILEEARDIKKDAIKAGFRFGKQIPYVVCAHIFLTPYHNIACLVELNAPTKITKITVSNLMGKRSGAINRQKFIHLSSEKNMTDAEMESLRKIQIYQASREGLMWMLPHLNTQVSHLRVKST